MTPLQVVSDEAPGPALDLPEELERHYGGPLRLAEDTLYANFVQTLDGVVAIPSVERSNAVIAAGSENDRFLMGLLRASADAVLIGSGTLTGSPRALWRAEGAYPPGTEAFAEIRARLGAPAHPEVVVITGSGRIDPAHPLFETGALVVTTELGAASLADRLPAATEVLPLGGAGDLDPRRVVKALRQRGHRRCSASLGSTPASARSATRRTRSRRCRCPPTSRR